MRGTWNEMGEGGRTERHDGKDSGTGNGRGRKGHGREELCDGEGGEMTL